MKNNSMVHILGGAQTDFERNWTKEGKGLVAILKEAIADGLKDAGLDYDEIISLNKNNRVACYVGDFIAEQYINQGHLGAFLTEVNSAFYGVPSARYEAACASSSVALDAAITKVQNGDYDVAIIVGWELMKTVDSRIGGDILGRAAFYEKEGKGIDFPVPKLFGKLADETIKKYNLDEKSYMDALANISTINYENAKRNPMAQTRKWFMSFEQASKRGTDTNPCVGGKLATSDCSQVTDGVAPMRFDKKMEDSTESRYILPWTRQAVMDAYRCSNLIIDDIDIFETHDCFTSSEYAAISAFGITEPGREWEAVDTGIISFSGAKPINPSGGLIGCGHPVGASGARMFLDIYKQVAGKAGNYQVSHEVKNAMMLNIGGSATTNYVFVVGVKDYI